MPIGSIISQPIADSIYAAYRPVVLKVAATRTDATPLPPVVYCDIYFNDVFYKTLSKTQYTQLNVGDSYWQFDIQDAAQEYLGKYLAAYAHSTVVEAVPIITKTSCKFRSSGYDSEGFITPEGTTPIQGTGDTDPVAGTGTASTDFYIVNATLQHEDNQNAEAHLYNLKKRTWATEALPLSHRPDHYVMNPDDVDSFPIIYRGSSTFKKLVLNYKLCGQSTFGQVPVNIAGAPSCNAIISQPTVEVVSGGWKVSWSLVYGTPAKYFVSTPAVSAGAPQETLVTEYTFASLPVGTHVITVRPLCLIEGEYYFGAAKTVTVEVAACVAVGFSGSTALPDAYVGVAYDFDISLTGTAPFSITNIVKPAWMTITLTGSTISHTGTPAEGDIGIDIEVSYDLSNCAGADTEFIDDTIDVIEPIVPEGVFQVGNYGSTFQIDGVSPAFYLITVGSFPVNDGELAQGNHSGITDADPIEVQISGSDGTPRTLTLLDNGSELQTLPVSSAGVYEFDPFNIAASHTILITLT